MRKRNVIIIDLDNTIAYEKSLDNTEIPVIPSRLEWDNFHKKKNMYSITKFKPIKNIINLIDGYYQSFKFEKPFIIFLTAREDKEKIRLNSYRFIKKYFKIFESPKCYNRYYTLLMRKENDFRSSSDVKEDILLNDILPNYNVLFVLDDEENNVQMFKNNGITCLKVYNGENNEDN